MEKKDLLAAAEQLADCELTLRRICRRLSVNAWDNEADKKELEAQLAKLRLMREDLLAKANRTLAAIPKLARKRYWWDIPFDESGSLWAKAPAFSGVYSEQTPVEETVHSGNCYLEEKPFRAAGSAMLDYFQYGYTPLYLNRKEFAAHLSDRMERRIIYCVRMTEEYSATVRSLSAAKPSGEGYGELVGQTHRQMASIEQDMEKKLALHNDVWDFMERWTHESFFTNEQRWLMGQMDTADYANENAGRNYREAEIRHKAWEEQMNLQYRLQQEKEKRLAAQWNQMTGQRTQISDCKLQMMETACAVYLGSELMAIYFPQQAQSIWEVYGEGGLSPVHLTGRVYNITEIKTAHPDLIPLFCHIMESYGNAMGPRSLLAAKPEGLSDEEWRCFVEIAWMYQKTK